MLLLPINYYSSIFTKASLSRIIGINERQLRHYAAGVHKPRKLQLERVQKGYPYAGWGTGAHQIIVTRNKYNEYSIMEDGMHR